MSFWGELKRRNVYKVGVAYAVVAWLIAQAVAIVFPALHLPGWAVTLVIALLIIGFPLILLFAWAFEITPEGIKRTKDVPLSESITHLTSKKLNYVLVGVIVVAVAYILFDNYYLDRRAIETKVVPTVAEEVPAIVKVEEAPKTIAVLPFVNRSSEKDQEYFVDGLTDEIITMLSQISGLQVTSSTSSFLFKDPDKSTQEIARVLGVEHILEGSVRKAGNALRISAQLIRAADDAHLWSESYDRNLDDIFAVQEDIAMAIADELKVTLDIDGTFRQAGGTENVEAYELYLFAKGQWGSGHTDVVSRALETIDTAVALDPEFALAWATKGVFQIWLSMFMPADQAPAAQTEALQATQRAVELAPDLADAYNSLGMVKMIKGDFFGAESAYRKVQELVPDSISFSDAYAVYLETVGYNEKANKVIESARRNDPLNQVFRGLYILSLGILGKTQEAEEEYANGRAIFRAPWDWGDDFIMAARLSSGDMVSPDDIRYSDPIYETLRAHLVSPEKGLAELRRLFATRDDLSSAALWCIAAWAAYFGDPELAMASIEKSIDLSSVEFMYVWLPLMQEARQLPRFKELVEKAGLVDYWNKFGWPDICHQLDNGDFECD